MLILRHYRPWEGVLAHDRFQGKDMLLKPIPGGSEAGHNSFMPRGLMEDVDCPTAAAWFNLHALMPTVSEGRVKKHMLRICKAHSYDPLMDHALAVRWDGVARIPTALQTYGGAKGHPLYLAAVARVLFVGLAARALQPGCKMENMIVFEGDENIGKTDLARILGYYDMPERETWFTDSLESFRGIDAADMMEGKWIIEVSELAALGKSSSEDVKKFLSKNADEFRRRYTSTKKRRPRRAVLIGTTNHETYLTSTTGNRRFLPVKLTKVERNALMADRDQLLAEAVNMYKEGIPWWIGDHEKELAALQRQEVEQRLVVDPWEEPILEFLLTPVDDCPRTDVCIPEIAEQVFEIRPKGQNDKRSYRIGSILRKLGWRRKGTIKRAAYRDKNRYVAPQPWPPKGTGKGS
ncbi:virulence-associated E family protein [Alloyangia pacifica]|uniref:Virulence-associated protein E n=1 Tax=Alloyangia pacifica TaxID=311180 RepID=A0A1I6WIK4_9RHOB|nr:virulence-associated E family protein [Alloyangia pacifica]SDI77900.1 Virulence-associated protein E [Alloyangia pacifica]SFT25601.1 Virulence-associated protein E [Alloyangia pacifica]